MSQGGPNRPGGPPPEGFAPGAPGRYEIPLGTPGRKGPSSFARAPEKPPKTHVGDSGLRETVETVVFVVVLVLLLKTFLAEAFVIPTGSMATTLYGYHLEQTCEQCGKPYPVNASAEAEPQPGGIDRITSHYCVNCQYQHPIVRPEGGGR